MIERGEGRPNEYRLKDGTRVPGVTTILGRFKESGGLLQWAFQQGKSGAANLYEKRDQAADAGTLVHAMVEADIHGTLPPNIPEEHEAAVVSAHSAWRIWFDSYKIRIIATEIPLVSEQYRFGGTVDAVGYDSRDLLCLVDWKSSNAIYTDYAAQVAAYQQLWNENRPSEPIVGGFHICRFAKASGDFEHRFFPELNDGWELFKHLIPAYELDKRLKARIR